MRKFFAILFLILGISFVALPFIPMGCSDVSASADEAFSITSSDYAVVPFYVPNVNQHSSLLFPLNYRYEYNSLDYPTPRQDNFYLFYYNGNSFEYVLLPLSFTGVYQASVYQLSATTFDLNFNCTAYRGDSNGFWQEVLTLNYPNVDLSNHYCSYFDYRRTSTMNNSFYLNYYFSPNKVDYFSMFDVGVDSIRIEFNITFSNATPSIANTSYLLPNITMFSLLDDDSYDKGFSDGDISGYRRGYSEGDTAGYSRGYDFGKRDGLNTSLSDVTPWDLLVQQVDAFFNLPLFGSSVTFGTILSIGFGLVLLGLSIKVFLGG